jgi:hypothetical protein
MEGIFTKGGGGDLFCTRVSKIYVHTRSITHIDRNKF